MAFVPGAASRKTRVSTTSSPSSNLSTVDGIINFARTQGIDLEEKKKKVSFLQRLGRGLSILEPVNAFYEAKYEGKNFVEEYFKDIFQEAGTVLTGTEKRTDTKRTFKDILVREGMKDREGKIDPVDLLGFAGDIFTDPGTYFGGAIVKGIGKGIKGGVSVAEKVGMKVAPEATTAIRAAGTAVKDSLGRAFVPAYGASKRAIKPSVEITENIRPLVDEALNHGTVESFVKKVGKTVEVLDPEKRIIKKVDTADIYKTYTEAKDLGTEVSKYANKVNKIKEEVGTKYSKLFDIPENIKENIFDGLYKVNKVFATKRNALIEAGTDIAEATKIVNKQVDSLDLTKFFPDPQTRMTFVNDIWPEIKKGSKRFSEITGMEEELTRSLYFPNIKKKQFEKFNSARMRVSSEGATKKFEGKLTKEEIVTDPAEAYAQRAFEVEKDGLTKSTLNEFVTRYGRPLNSFKTADEATQAGYQILKEKGMFGKDLGYLKKDDARIINELFDPSFKAVNDMAKALGYDWLTALFKKSVTGLFPSFHARNFISGHIQNFEALGFSAINPVTVAEGNSLAKKILSKEAKLVGKEIELGGTKFSVEELVTKFRERFNLSSQYISDFGWEAQQKLLKKESKINPFYHARNIGNYIETQQKSTAMLAAIKKGYSVDEALKLAETAGFDYAKMTPFEKHIMRRIIPFYSFTRKNLELQLKTVLNNPERLALITKAFRSAGSPQGTSTGDINMPDWMREQFSIKSDKPSPYGLPQVISGFGTPIEAATQNLDNGLLGILATFNPLLKVPLESATGKDFFRNRDLKDVYTAKEYSGKMVPQVIKDFLKLNEKETEIYKGGQPTGKMKTVYIADPERLHIARNLFTSRGFSYLDTAFGEKELTPFFQTLKLTTGIKPYELDEESIKFFDDRDNYRDLTDMLMRLGVVKSFEQIYVPKQK